MAKLRRIPIHLCFLTDMKHDSRFTSYGEVFDEMGSRKIERRGVSLKTY
jgi:hypothetical protein